MDAGLRELEYDPEAVTEDGATLLPENTARYLSDLSRFQVSTGEQTLPRAYEVAKGQRVTDLSASVGSALGASVILVSLHPESQSQKAKRNLKVLTDMSSPFMCQIVDHFYREDCLHLVFEPSLVSLEELPPASEPVAASLLAKGLTVLSQLHSRGLSLQGVLNPALFLFQDRSYDQLQLSPLTSIIAFEALRDAWILDAKSEAGRKMDLNALNFVAPELRRRMLNREALEGIDEQAADIWALGATVYWMLTGTTALHSTNSQPGAASAGWAGLSGVANNLLQKMMFAEPKWRITVATALQHKFVRQALQGNTTSRKASTTGGRSPSRPSSFGGPPPSLVGVSPGDERSGAGRFTVPDTPEPSTIL